MMDWTPPPPLACSLTPIHAPTPRTIENDTQSRVDDVARRISAAVLWPWMIRPLLIGLALFVGLLRADRDWRTTLTACMVVFVGLTVFLGIQRDTLPGIDCYIHFGWRFLFVRVRNYKQFIT